MSHEPRIGPDLRGPSVDLALDLDLGASLGAKGEIERLVHQRLDLDLLRRGGESASLVEKPADDLRHPLDLAADDLHLRARLLAQIRATGEKLDVAADGIERIAELVGDGPGELSEGREPFLRREVAAGSDQELVQLLQSAVLPRQL